MGVLTWLSCHRYNAKFLLFCKSQFHKLQKRILWNDCLKVKFKNGEIMKIIFTVKACLHTSLIQLFKNSCRPCRKSFNFGKNQLVFWKLFCCPNFSHSEVSKQTYKNFLTFEPVWQYYMLNDISQFLSLFSVFRLLGWVTKWKSKQRWNFCNLNPRTLSNRWGRCMHNFLEGPQKQYWALSVNICIQRPLTVWRHVDRSFPQEKTAQAARAEPHIDLSP